MLELEKKIDKIMSNLSLGFYTDKQAMFLIKELFTGYLIDLSK